MNLVCFGLLSFVMPYFGFPFFMSFVLPAVVCIGSIKFLMINLICFHSFWFVLPYRHDEISL